MTILITDDSLFIRKTLSAMIQQLGFETVEAVNGKDCLDAIEDNKKIECVILDLMMPEIDGFEVLKALQGKNGVPPVIVLSADIQDTIKDECLSLGAAAFLNKPPKSTIISKILEKVLGVE